MLPNDRGGVTRRGSLKRFAGSGERWRTSKREYFYGQKAKWHRGKQSVEGVCVPGGTFNYDWKLSRLKMYGGLNLATVGRQKGERGAR